MVANVTGGAILSSSDAKKASRYQLHHVSKNNLSYFTHN